MSWYNGACCEWCGIDLYVPLGPVELRNGVSKHVNFYIVPDNGRQVELCPICYDVWKEQNIPESEESKHSDDWVDEVIEKVKEDTEFIEGLNSMEGILTDDYKKEAMNERSNTL